MARSLLYLQAGLSLVIAPSWAIFTASAGDDRQVHCDGLAGITMLCSISGVPPNIVTHIAGVLLIAFATGILPALTALPATWILVSVSLSGTIIDGGDQLAAILGLFLLPISLLDWRFSTWSRSLPKAAEWSAGVLTGNVSWWLMRAQIVAVYLEASLGKLNVAEWDSGQALYDWVRNPLFGAPDWLSPLVYGATGIPLVAAAASYGVIALEFILAISLAMPRPVRVRLLFPLGVALHVAIVLVMGVSSFSLVMLAALAILVLPIDVGESDIPAFRTLRTLR